MMIPCNPNWFRLLLLTAVLTTGKPAMAQDTPCPVYFANIFSPNGDGINDTFQPQFGTCTVITYEFRIFNRWGELVFQSKLPGEGWNGETGGQPAEGQIFTYVLQITFEQGEGTEEEIFFGDIAVLR